MLGVNQHRDICMVLGGRSDQGGSADIDVLDRRCAVRACRNRLLKRIKIGDDKIDRRKTVPIHLPSMRRIIALGQNAAVDARMERLDAAVENSQESQ